MSFSIIAVVGKNRELGKNGRLLWHLPEDLQFFKKTTLGHPILMGRKTFESLPSMLPGRKHYVVTRGNQASVSLAAPGSQPVVTGESPLARSRRRGDPPVETDDLALQDDNLTVVCDLADFVKQPRDEEIFVIGGGMIYREMLKFADTLYLTEVDAEAPDADTFFPEFNKNDFKREVLGKGSRDGLDYQFVKYTRN